MEKLKILKKDAPLSKAINFLLKEGTAVVVMDGDKIKGIIDDRHMKDVKTIDRTKVGNVAVKCPRIYEGSSLKDKIKAFLNGHFKALPYLNKKGKLKGLISRTDLFEEILEKGLIPNKLVSEVMASPAYTIDFNKTIGEAKRKMKEKKVHKLVVTKNKKIVGVISSFDLLGLIFLMRRGRQRMQLIPTNESIDKKRVGDYVREKVRIKKSDSLERAIKKMIKHKESSLIVAEKEIPKGILSALDIFKLILREMKKRESITISGLNEDTSIYYTEIESKMNKILEKIKPIFKFPKPKLHVKKGKSVFQLTFQIKLNNKPYSIKAKDYKMNLALKKLEKEIKKIISKLKTQKNNKGKR